MPDNLDCALNRAVEAANALDDVWQELQAAGLPAGGAEVSPEHLVGLAQESTALLVRVLDLLRQSQPRA